MKDINLLPVEFQNNRMTSARKLLSVLGLIVLFIFFCLLTVDEINKKEGLETELDLLKNELDNLVKTNMEIQNKEEELSHLESTYSLYQQLEYGEPSLWNNCLTAVYSFRSRDISILTISMESSKINISGIASSDQTVLDYSAYLKDTKLFSDVELIKIAYNSGDKIAFQILSIPSFRGVNHE